MKKRKVREEKKGGVDEVRRMKAGVGLLGVFAEMNINPYVWSLKPSANPKRRMSSRE